MSALVNYNARSGRLLPVWTLEIQTLPEDTDRILDAVMAVHPLSFSVDIRRNASISAIGKESAQPQRSNRPRRRMWPASRPARRRT